MFWLNLLTTATVLLYFAGGAMGWALSIAAWGSARFYPALSYTGTGIGLLPTYLGLLFVLRKFGWVAATVDIWQRVTSCLVTLAIMVAAVAALKCVLVARKQEREERARVAQLEGKVLDG
jgi:hypothetical protein